MNTSLHLTTTATVSPRRVDPSTTLFEAAEAIYLDNTALGNHLHKELTAHTTIESVTHAELLSSLVVPIDSVVRRLMKSDFLTSEECISAAESMNRFSMRLEDSIIEIGEDENPFLVAALESLLSRCVEIVGPLVALAIDRDDKAVKEPFCANFVAA